MRLTQRAMILAAATIAMIATPGLARAHGSPMNMLSPALVNYTGAWPVTITGSQFSNGTGCLTLSGHALSGQASLVFGNQKYSYGSFVVINGILVANITEPLYGQNGALMFIAHANHSHIGQGVYENIEGGSNFDFGVLAFGAKNSC